MNNLILAKLDELFKVLDNCSDIKDMKKLKQDIKKDKQLNELLEEYKTLNSYDPKIKNIKEQIIHNSLIKRYRELENKLYFTVLDTNIKLNSLVDKKRCSNEDN